jgi:hypothetical protein
MQFVKAKQPETTKTTRNPVRNQPRISCEKTRGGSGQTGMRTRAHTRMAELKTIPRPNSFLPQEPPTAAVSRESTCFATHLLGTQRITGQKVQDVKVQILRIQATM